MTTRYSGQKKILQIKILQHTKGNQSRKKEIKAALKWWKRVENTVAKYERKKKSGSYISCLSSSISSWGNNIPILNNHTAGNHINNITIKSYSRYNVE